ncbi:MAG: hypothetical protein FD126_1280 [Elusimicrobia bacterium]|nr:MAG: hypothetical protein FD126_1280 [Elusimicrobiota bacterium]
MGTRFKEAALAAAVLAAAPASAGIQECRDAAGHVRYTNKACKDGEASRDAGVRPHAPPPDLSAPPAASAPDKPKGTAGPLLQAAKEGGRLAVERRTLLIEAATQVETRGADKVWRALRPVRPSSLAALKRAVDSFNAVPGLTIRLEYAEASDPGASMAKAEEANGAGRFIAHWADFPGVPFQKKPWSIGCFPFYRQKDGRVVSWCSPRRKGGESIGGAWIQLAEIDPSPEYTMSCGADTEAVYALRYLGDCLGLKVGNDGSSVMAGACSTSFLPADREALRRLYGEESDRPRPLE